MHRGLAPRAAAVLALAAVPVSAQTEPPSAPPADWEATAIDYSNVPYPHPVSYLDVEVYGDPYRLAYMDVPPPAPRTDRPSCSSTG
ncbi:hypothetical protein [Candidatus Palauibacter sp.]|uniref:hypothetical protein n=1 Tax=Candidatus Palauibacter sp. TaxID=3101350 RepID=UPI003AF29ABD